MNEQANEMFTDPIGDYLPEELNPMSQDSMDITRKMFALRHIKKAIEQYEKQIEESLEFYNRKIDGLRKQTEFLEADIWGYLNRHGHTNIVTPAGTASVQTRESWTWGDDGAILAYARGNAPDLIKVNAEEKVSKNDLKKHLKETQNVPPEVAIVTEEKSIVVRLNP